jgi:hypothetical protein
MEKLQSYSDYSLNQVSKFSDEAVFFSCILNRTKISNKFPVLYTLTNTSSSRLRWECFRKCASCYALDNWSFGLKVCNDYMRFEYLSLLLLQCTVKSNVSFTLQMSSRSHCVLTIYIEQHTGIRTLQDVIVTRLNLVELARNDYLKKTLDYRGHLRTEAIAINNKSCIPWTCLVSLANSESCIPISLGVQHLGQNRANHQVELWSHKTSWTVMCTPKLPLCFVEPNRMLTRHSEWGIPNCLCSEAGARLYPIPTELSHQSGLGILAWQLQNHFDCLHMAKRLFLGHCYGSL